METMRLRDFIAGALEEITEGIRSAQGPVAKAGGAVNPKDCQYLMPGSGTIQHKPTSRVGQDVEFDLAVTVSAATKSGAKGKFGISIAAIGAEGQCTTENSVVNRIRFKIPVIFPKGEYSENT